MCYDSNADWNSPEREGFCLRTSKILSVFLMIMIAILIPTGAVAVPLLYRPFYYAHIEVLCLPDLLGLSAEQIRQAFNEVMDYCMGRAGSFSSGVFPFSESGAAHFADVRFLFRLDLILCVASLGALLVTFFWCRYKNIEPHRPSGHGSGFWAAVCLLVGFLVVGGLAALDFERVFRLFHGIFFPGQDNWLFSVYEDPMILILPEVFFRNCAILILVLIVIWCIVLIVADCWIGKRIRWAEEQAKLPPCHRTPFKKK